jgi:FkbM family methyltransferase
LSSIICGVQTHLGGYLRCLKTLGNESSLKLLNFRKYILLSSNIFAGIGVKVRGIIGALYHRPGRRADLGLYYQITALIDAAIIARLRKIYYGLKFELLGFRAGLQRHPSGLIGLPVKIGTIRRPFHVRYSSRGDLGVYYQIFINRDYDLTHFPQARKFGSFYDSLVKENKRPLIIDAGSNIGASIVWFAARYPLSKIAAIEPNKKNCELLTRNCSGIDYELFSGGIGSADGVMYLEDPGFSDWGFRVTEAGTEEVRIFSATKLVDSLANESTVPFIMKVDIEGGERYLFERDAEWVNRFPLLIVELHDYMLPGISASNNFLKCISRYYFDFVIRGENVFCFNNEILANN